MKKLISVIMTMIMVMSMGTIGFAEGIEELKTISKSEVPQGVIPIKVDTEGEMLQVIDSIQFIENGEIIVGNKTRSGNRNVTNYKSVGTITLGNKVFSTCKFNIFAELYIGSFSGVGIIESVNYVDCSLTGYTAGMDISNKNASSRISKDKKSVTLSGSATLDYYFLIDGGIKLYSKPINHSWTYKL